MDSFQFLFNSSYDRFVGNPRQTLIHSPQELHNFIARNNGFHPCYVTLNSFLGQYTVARSIFNDFDAEFTMTCKKCGKILKDTKTARCECGNFQEFEKEPESKRLPKVYEKIRQAQKLFLTYKEYKIDCVPHFTAYKGIHILPLFKPERFTNADLITKLFYFFINEAKCYQPVEVEDINGVKKILKEPFADTVVISDLRRLCRITGTRRPENGLYCIAIPPEDFPYLEPEEIYAMAKSPTASVKVPEPKQKMSEFEFTPVDTSQFKVSRSISGNETMDSTLLSLSKDVKQTITDFIPQKCLQELLPTMEPLGAIRYSGVVHLRQIGMSPHGIIDLFSRLGWRDFSLETTTYQVNNIYSKGSCRFSCQKIRSLGCWSRDQCTKSGCTFRRSNARR